MHASFAFLFSFHIFSITPSFVHPENAFGQVINHMIKSYDYLRWESSGSCWSVPVGLVSRGAMVNLIMLFLFD